MVKFAIIAFLGLVAVGQCAPAETEPVPIVAQDSDIQPDGAFKWSFETGDGAKQEQTGVPKQIDQETPVVLQGSASWTDSEGNPHQLSYVADENGYQPQSDDIPQAPEIPAAIARALEYIAAHPQPDSEKQQA
ncbi:larval cuticle protein 1-like [Dendroctonus ponderosae]|uniref:larval cuticle protein 1-like n=1 Tax=Dendroctonus ponderosae TaxID=77166 RepID=UPI002035C945|nr:larval cuticle protein 1-like [Dendroctonus ponderosae]KAH1004877.1 hypothetical protein HUJ05_005645 [Dendroctonus ponderosae]